MTREIEPRTIWHFEGNASLAENRMWGVELEFDANTNRRKVYAKTENGTVIYFVEHGQKIYVSEVQCVGNVIAKNIPLHNLEATTDPLPTDDASSGYSYGSMWINQVLKSVYICTDPTNSAALWERVDEGAGTFVRSTERDSSVLVTGSAVHADDATSKVYASFSKSHGLGNFIDENSGNSSVTGNSNSLVSASYSVVSGDGNVIGFEELAIDSSWVFTPNGTLMELVGPSWTFPQYKGGTPYETQENLVNSFIEISATPSLANDGVFLVVAQEGNKITYRNDSGVSGTSATNTKVKFLGSSFVICDGNNNVQINSDYSKVHGKNCYVINAPFSSTKGNGAHNEWAGSIVESNGPSGLSGAAGSQFLKPTQHIKAQYSGLGLKDATTLLYMFPDDTTITEVTIPQREFRFRKGYDYDFFVRAFGSAFSETVILEQGFTISNVDDTPAGCTFVGSISESVVGGNPASVLELNPTIQQRTISGQDGEDSTGMFLQYSTVVPDGGPGVNVIVNGDFALQRLVDNGWSGSDNDPFLVSNGPAGYPGTDTYLFADALGNSIFQPDVLKVGVEYRLQAYAWALLGGEGPVSNLAFTCGGQFIGGVNANQTWQTLDGFFTAAGTDFTISHTGEFLGQYMYVGNVIVTGPGGDVVWALDLDVREVPND